MDQAALQWVPLEQSSGAPCGTGAPVSSKSLHAWFVRQWMRIFMTLLTSTSCTASTSKAISSTVAPTIRVSVWKFDALWEHPLCKGEATCHSSSWHSFMHRRYVEGYYKSSSLTHDANGREHSTCCGRNLCIWPRSWSQYSISLRTHHSVTSWDVIDQCWPECGVLISSTSYSGFCLSLVQLIAWAEDTCIGSTLRLFIVSSTLRSLFSPSDENIQLKLLEKSLS